MTIRTRFLRWAAILAVFILLAACGEPPSTTVGAESEPSSTQEPPEASEEEHGEVDFERPPPVTIRYFDQYAELEAWTFCYGTVCADGSPPADPVDVGSPEQIIVEFPLTGWTFDASFRPTGEECGREQQVALDATGDGQFVVTPAGFAGTYDVTLFGRGDGDLFVTFRWTTTEDGPLPEPEARLAVLAGHDGRVDSYGIELMLTNLATTPEEASATITVRAENGNAINFEGERARGRCWYEGTVYWDGPDDKGLAAAALGEGPFTYEVELLLDGERYVATATWPDDEIEGNEPSVSLVFEPDLPALS